MERMLPGSITNGARPVLVPVNEPPRPRTGPQGWAGSSGGLDSAPSATAA